MILTALSLNRKEERLGFLSVICAACWYWTTYHGSVQLYKAPRHTLLGELLQRIPHAQRNEKELLVDPALFGELARCCENWATSKADSSESCLRSARTTFVLEPPSLPKKFDGDVLIFVTMQDKRESAANARRPYVPGGIGVHQVASRYERMMKPSPLVKIRQVLQLNWRSSERASDLRLRSDSLNRLRPISFIYDTLFEP